MAKLNGGYVEKAVYGIIILTVLFLVLANLMPTLISAGDDLNDSGVPLGSLFLSGGVVFLLIMAGIIITIVKNWLPSKR